MAGGGQREQRQSVQVELAGEFFQFRTSDAVALLQAARMVNREYARLHQRYPTVPRHRLALLLALQFAAAALPPSLSPAQTEGPPGLASARTTPGRVEPAVPAAAASETPAQTIPESADSRTPAASPLRSQPPPPAGPEALRQSGGSKYSSLLEMERSFRSPAEDPL